MDELTFVIEKQKDFQRFLGVPIDSNLEKDRNKMSEDFVSGLIEESVELRKEFPSVRNPWSKLQKDPDFTRIREEMSDIFLYLMNLLATWRVTPKQLLDTVESVQTNNFMKVKEKKMKMLNESIQNIPGYTVNLGFGSLNPKKIYVGNFNGTVFDGSCYYTKIVKCELPNGRKPNEDELIFWTPLFEEEMAILRETNPNMEIIYV